VLLVSAIAANRADLGGKNVHEYDADHAPYVPALCLTSPDDRIIPPEQVT
jgi:hypothetical protein